MEKKINKVAILGAGVMGAQIAGHEGEMPYPLHLLI